LAYCSQLLIASITWSDPCPSDDTLSSKAMNSENPYLSLRLILSARVSQSSFEVEAESASNVLLVPSMKVMGSMIGFFDFVACNSNHEGGWFLLPFANVLLILDSQ